MKPMPKLKNMSLTMGPGLFLSSLDAFPVFSYRTHFDSPQFQQIVKWITKLTDAERPWYVRLPGDYPWQTQVTSRKSQQIYHLHRSFHECLKMKLRTSQFNFFSPTMQFFHLLQLPHKYIKMSKSRNYIKALSILELQH